MLFLFSEGCYPFLRINKHAVIKLYHAMPQISHSFKRALQMRPISTAGDRQFICPLLQSYGIHDYVSLISVLNFLFLTSAMRHVT